MGQRLSVVGFGIAALFAGTVGAAAPQALAQEVAPGVSCVGYRCSNDTDDTYRVQATVACSLMGSSATYTSVAVTTYVPARGFADVVASCPTYTEMGTWEQQPSTLQPDGSLKTEPPVWRPGDSYQTFPSGIEYGSAVVDNDPPPAPSGSFG